MPVDFLYKLFKAYYALGDDLNAKACANALMFYKQLDGNISPELFVKEVASYADEHFSGADRKHLRDFVAYYSEQCPSSFDINEIALKILAHENMFSDRAMQAATRVLEQRPTDVAANVFIGRLHLARGKNSFDIAEKYFKNALDGHPANAEASYCLGTIEEAKKHKADAEKLFLVGARSDNDKVKFASYGRLGENAFKRGDDDKALFYLSAESNYLEQEMAHVLESRRKETQNPALVAGTSPPSDQVMHLLDVWYALAQINERKRNTEKQIGYLHEIERVYPKYKDVRTLVARSQNATGYAVTADFQLAQADEFFTNCGTIIKAYGCETLAVETRTNDLMEFVCRRNSHMDAEHGDLTTSQRSFFVFDRSYGELSNERLAKCLDRAHAHHVFNLVFFSFFNPSSQALEAARGRMVSFVCGKRFNSLLVQIFSPSEEQSESIHKSPQEEAPVLSERPAADME